MTNQETTAEALRRIDQELSEMHATLADGELVWKAKGPLFESHGYRLRPRYHDGWIPSWLNKDVELESCEDWYSTFVCFHT